LPGNYTKTLRSLPGNYVQQKDDLNCKNIRASKDSFEKQPATRKIDSAKKAFQLQIKAYPQALLRVILLPNQKCKSICLLGKQTNLNIQ
jgi:hypothetical protein